MFLVCKSYFRIEQYLMKFPGGCGSFYAISITSDAFKDLSTVKQHRLVNEVLKKEIEGIHGLQVRYCHNL